MTQNEIQHIATGLLFKRDALAKAFADRHGPSVSQFEREAHNNAIRALETASQELIKYINAPGIKL